jgi:hypothetical protein
MELRVNGRPGKRGLEGEHMGYFNSKSGKKEDDSLS